MQSAIEKIVRAVMPTAVAAVGLYVALIIAPIKENLEQINARLDKLEAKSERASEVQSALQAEIAEIRGRIADRLAVSSQPQTGDR